MTLAVAGIEPDPSRLVVRPFLPGSSVVPHPQRLGGIVDRVLALPEPKVAQILGVVEARAGDRYGDVRSAWSDSFDLARQRDPQIADVTDPMRRLLVGAYLTQGYAYEAVALTNPSIVSLGDGRFVLTARAVGEGHISSIAFITGSIDADGRIRLDERSLHVSNGSRRFPPFDKAVFERQLVDLGLAGTIGEQVLAMLGDDFTGEELSEVLSDVAEGDVEGDTLDTTRRIQWLAASNYLVDFDPRLPISEHLMSPATPVESRGMEDARFVRFVDDDGSVIYFATYTAYDGAVILPQLIETSDFHRFRVTTLAGPAIHHKGMALFPRKIGGDYVALSRHDHERTFLLRSRDVRTWPRADVILEPELEWELVQTGNSGSPIETPEGWLVVTHGVGPMRRYVLGAVLLDLDDPKKVVARLSRPLLEPEDGDHGLVPEVVYSCGSMLHGELLVLPYGYSDYGIRIAVMPVETVLSSMS
jgi:predicted GH43/DUF377 family glycosyl hydrolase